MPLLQAFSLRSFIAIYELVKCFFPRMCKQEENQSRIPFPYIYVKPSLFTLSNTPRVIDQSFTSSPFANFHDIFLPDSVSVNIGGLIRK